MLADQNAPERPRTGGPARGVPGLWRDHGLTLTLLAAFLFSLVGMALAGWGAHGRDLVEHGAPAIGLGAYLVSGAFLSALFENWESEFLQMSAYVMLTAFLFQRGSAESRDPDAPGHEPLAATRLASRFLGLARFLRAYSLGIALAILFILSFAGHLSASLRAINAEAALHGAAPETAIGLIADPRFWFESFQNWQSEFLSTAVLVVLSIFLRFHGSPESKRVDDPNRKTGK